MSITLAAVAIALLTAALLWEEWSWQRNVRRQQQPMPVIRGRCLCCDGAPLVEDIHTHSRLAHRPRERAAEDHPEFSGWTP